MTATAVGVIDAGAYVKPEVLAEVVYVLQKVYSVQRSEIRNVLIGILATVECTEKECVLFAINLYETVPLDFVDCLLVAYHKINKETVFSFDKKLNRHLSQPEE